MMPSLGTRLAQFRLENGWSKRGVAHKLGVSTPSIIRWEEGMAEPNDYNRYKIERLLETVHPLAPSALVRVHPLPLFPEREGRQGGR